MDSTRVQQVQVRNNSHGKMTHTVSNSIRTVNHSEQIFDAITDGEKENTGYFIQAVELLVQMGISTGITGMLKNLKERQIRLSLKDKPLG